jgi:hypothetical protein
MMCTLCRPSSWLCILVIKLQVKKLSSLEWRQSVERFQKQQLLMSYIMTLQVPIDYHVIVKVGIDPIWDPFHIQNHIVFYLLANIKLPNVGHFHPCWQKLLYHRPSKNNLCICRYHYLPSLTICVYFFILHAIYFVKAKFRFWILVFFWVWFSRPDN